MAGLGTEGRGCPLANCVLSQGSGGTGPAGEKGPYGSAVTHRAQCPPSGTVQAFAPGGAKKETRDSYSQLQELGVSGIQRQAAQSSLWPTRSSWPCGLQEGIPSASSDAVGKGALECHSPGHGGCGGLRLPAWAQHLPFPEHGTAMDCPVETVGCLQQPHQVMPCPARSPRERQGHPGPTCTCCWECSCCRRAFMPAAKRRRRVTPSWRSCWW